MTGLAFLALGGAAQAQDVGVAELAAAQAAVQRASDADADQYAPDLIQAARDKISQAQALGESRSGRKQVPLLAQQAQADADLARARSAQAAVQARLAQEQSEIDRLQKVLAAPPPAPPAPPPAPLPPLPPQDALPTLPSAAPGGTP